MSDAEDISQLLLEDEWWGKRVELTGQGVVRFLALCGEVLTENNSSLSQLTALIDLCKPFACG
jgi:hypothetical protein